MQIPAEFKPRSWEMPPGARVLEDSASVVAREFDGEKLDWLVALVEVPALNDAILWVRPMDARFDAGFVTFRGSDLRLMVLDVNVEPFALRASLDTVWKTRKIARLCFFNQHGQLRRDGEAAHESLLVASNGTAAWNLNGIGNPNRDSVVFTFGAPSSNAQFSRRPAFEVWKSLQDPLSDSSSEATFARQFVQLTEQECRDLIFNNVRGTDKEMEEWLHTLLLREDAWSEPALGQELRLHSYAPDHLELFWDDDYFGEPATATPELEAGAARVRNWFLPVNQEVAQRSCVKQWLRRNNPRLRVSIHHPSAHQQLEAALRWREWLASTGDKV